MLLQPGTYAGSVGLKKSGEEGKPIVWRGVDVDQVILNGSGKDERFSPGLSPIREPQLHRQPGLHQDLRRQILSLRCKFFKFRYRHHRPRPIPKGAR
jgi:hypothetical protein